MKKIILLSFLLPLPALAGSFYPINQAGPDLHVIESYPALGIVMVEEDGGFPNQYHYISDGSANFDNTWNANSLSAYNTWETPYWNSTQSAHWGMIPQANHTTSWHTSADWYATHYSDPSINYWWDWFPPVDDWWGSFPPVDGGWDWLPPWDGWDPNPWPPFPDPEPTPDPDPWPDPTPTGATWGLDRINQRNLPLDGKYDLIGSSNVTAYIVDTGVQAHSQLGASLQSGFNANGGNDTSDCMGHGTHVAGTVAATDYGVAPNTKIVPVKVFPGCSASTTTQLILRGLNYVAESDARPAVVNMSLGGGADQALDDGVSALIRKGIHVVVAAGNDNGADACYGSPGRLGRGDAVITVGATTRYDDMASFTNVGPCVNIYAPGQDIESLTPQGGITTMNGTSMASPHVAGAVALYLATTPSATPAEGKQYIDALGTTDVVKRFGSITGDKLLFVEEGAPNEEEQE